MSTKVLNFVEGMQGSIVDLEHVRDCLAVKARAENQFNQLAIVHRDLDI